MRKLILDTETTGLDPEKDRIIELACIELIDDIPSGVKFHQYYNSDGIIISHEAELIHGINNKYLRKFRSFDEKIDEFLEFVGNDNFVIHNAQFDLSMINNSLNRCGKPQFSRQRSICTLELAKKKFPGSKNNLNALCKRFNISLESREKHGALTDCYLLQRVYTELLGGRQGNLNLDLSNRNKINLNKAKEVPRFTKPILAKIFPEEEELHEKMLKRIPNSFWKA